MRKFIGFVATVCLTAVLIAGCSGSTANSSTTASQQPVASSTPVPAFPEDPAYIEEREIVYANVDDVALKLDLYRPVEGDGPFPAIVFMASGSWISANRDEYFTHSTWAADRGYVAVTIDRRGTIESDDDGQPKYPFPAPLHDVKCAVRWLRSNAEELGIDPDRIGAVGYSDGGHFALLLALTDPSDGLEGDCGDSSQSSRVQAAVNVGGDPDLAFVYDAFPNTAQSGLSRLLGGNPEEQPEEYRLASPNTYVSEGDPPVLTIYGDLDGDVFIKPLELLDLEMKEAGASHTLIILELVGHRGLMPKGYAPPNVAHDPDPELYETVFEFLDSQLMNEN